jgi:hypothetical protein
MVKKPSGRIRRLDVAICNLKRNRPKQHSADLRRDPLYKAKALGRSKGRLSAVHHDVVLYPR